MITALLLLTVATTTQSVAADDNIVATRAEIRQLISGAQRLAKRSEFTNRKGRQDVEQAVVELEKALRRFDSSLTTEEVERLARHERLSNQLVIIMPGGGQLPVSHLRQPRRR
jgi:hypothetical protein